MIIEKNWKEFVEVCKKRWCGFMPDKMSIQLYQAWESDRLKNMKWLWKRSAKDDS